MRNNPYIRMVLQKLRTFSCRIKILLLQLRKGIIIVYYDQEITILSLGEFFTIIFKIKSRNVIHCRESRKKLQNLKITQNSAI